MRKVRDVVERHLTPTLKPAHRPRKEEEDKCYPGNTYRGNNADYIRARLKDEHPDLFAQVANREETTIPRGMVF